MLLSCTEAGSPASNGMAMYATIDPTAPIIEAKNRPATRRSFCFSFSGERSETRGRCGSKPGFSTRSELTTAVPEAAVGASCFSTAVPVSALSCSAMRFPFVVRVRVRLVASWSVRSATR